MHQPRLDEQARRFSPLAPPFPSVWIATRLEDEYNARISLFARWRRGRASGHPQRDHAE